jgi:hypothetical protein
VGTRAPVKIVAKSVAKKIAKLAPRAYNMFFNESAPGAISQCSVGWFFFDSQGMECACRYRAVQDAQSYRKDLMKASIRPVSPVFRIKMTRSPQTAASFVFISSPGI